MKKSIVLYLHIHQPYRIGDYSIFDIGGSRSYFDSDYQSNFNNQRILHKVAQKSYIPTVRVLKKLLDAHPEFRFSISITGTVIEQMINWEPQVLEAFRDLVSTGRVEIVGETYHHSLAFLYSRSEFENQVNMHKDLIAEVFNKQPTSFRGTELIYNNDLAYWADKAGYKAIIAEGWGPAIGGVSPNHVFKPAYTDNIKLLLKNYQLSDDLAFRFSDRSWSEFPLDPAKYCHWIDEADQSAETIGLFMDFETFGEHQWEDSGIFDFLEKFPATWLESPDHDFATISEAADMYQVTSELDIPQIITWADTERDLTAWLGNSMQQVSLRSLYDFTDKIMSTNDLALIEDWRKLQTSDQFYYMCTKWHKDGDVHAYFSPYESPYEGHIYFMNAWHDLKSRLIDKGFVI